MCKAWGRLAVHVEEDREARVKPLVGWWVWCIKGEDGCWLLLFFFLPLFALTLLVAKQRRKRWDLIGYGWVEGGCDWL